MKWLSISIAMVLVGTLSYLLLRKSEQLNTLQEDLRDTKTLLEIELSGQAVDKARENYERKKHEYLKTILSASTTSNSTVILIPESGEGSADPDTRLSSTSASLPRGPGRGGSVH